MDKSETRNEGSLILLGLEKNKKEMIRELFLPVILFSTIGAFYWAIRGSSGYGGSSGATFTGLGWALAWFFLSHESSEEKSRPYSLGWIVLAITLGIGIGGMHGYGQFISWIRGEFRIDGTDITTSINPIIGYLWLFQCGLAWGGTAGVFMAWCGSKKPPKKKDWGFRILFGIAGALIGYLITVIFPGLINPLYDTVDYFNCPDCERTLSTSQSSMILLWIFLALLFYEFLRKEWRGVLLTITMALGFGLGFSIFAFWHYGYEVAGINLDWWKFWEMSIGFIGGMTFGICYYLYNRPFGKKDIHLVRVQPYSKHKKAERILGIELTIFIALSWSFYNGIGGFLSNFICDKEGCTPAQNELVNSSRLIYSIPIITSLLFLFILFLYKTYKKPFNPNDGRIIIKKPALRFLIIHSVLVTLGYMVTFNSEMSCGSWLLIWIYTFLLIIGLISFLILFKIKSKT